MNPTTKTRQALWGLSVSLNTLWKGALAVAFFLFLCTAALGQQDKYRIEFQARTFTPPPGIALTLQDNLIAQLQQDQPQHVYFQLLENLTDAEVKQLEAIGVTLHSYIGSQTWYATVSRPQVANFTDPNILRRYPILKKVRWIGKQEVNDKIQPKILREGVGEYNKNEDGTVNVIVEFFPDVKINAINAVVARYGEVIRKPGMLNDVVVKIAPTRIAALAKEDGIRWIEEVGPPDVDHNDGAMATANVTALWALPFNLSGENVQIGQWESGNPDDTHGDLSGRINVVENEGTTNHATHVAGTAMGDGSESAGAGGTANQWRGVADEAEIFSYSTAVDNLEPEDHDGAINDADKQIDLSTNSWGTTSDGYTARSTKYDRIVKGVYGRRIPIICSAGNDDHVFNSVGAPLGTAKNTITVGNINSDDLSISWTASSWGPTEQEMLKPNIVAPGDEVGGDTGTTSSGATSTYYTSLGTSMSTPVVSGTVALMLEQYRITYYNDVNSDAAPLPSTFKAILCHTATDLIDHPLGGADLVGPDYVYGYGLINARAAVEALMSNRLIENALLSPTDEDTYTFEVAAGDEELKVTLAWDDLPGNAGDTHPNFIKNDLDLLVINPAGDAFYVPWILDPDNPTNPAVRNFYATEALADGNRDDANVVEQVAIEDPVAGTWTIKIKSDDLPGRRQRYSLMIGEAPMVLAESSVDVMQVLDRSGSMRGLAAEGMPETKVEVLRDASSQFVQMMKPDVGNRLGLALFNEDNVRFEPYGHTQLQELTTARATRLVETIIPTIPAGGNTSVGDGLLEAVNQFTALGEIPEHDRAILLVTDGKENESEWIDDVIDDEVLQDNEIAVYPLGLGYGYGVDEQKLIELADSTGGSYRITADPIVFRRFFIEILAGAVDWDVVLGADGDSDDFADADADDSEISEKVKITKDQQLATFTAYWQGADDAMMFVLKTPSNKEINLKTMNSGVRIAKEPNYIIYQLQFPLAGEFAGEWEGEWTLEVESVTNQSFQYGLSAFVDEGVKLVVDLDKTAIRTGEAVTVQARLMKGEQIVPGATIMVYGDTPLDGPGNILHENTVGLDILRDFVKQYEDIQSLVNAKIQYLQDQAAGELFNRTQTSFQLYDDGQHGDGRANDGIYGNRFTSTQKQGAYTFRFLATDIPTTSGVKVRREWTQSFYNEVDTDPDYSVIKKKLRVRPNPEMKSPQYSYDLTITPQDRFGNYMGPGRTITGAYGNGRTVDFFDNVNGTYRANIPLSADQAKTGLDVDVTIQDKQFEVVALPPAFKKWQVSFHGGYTYPVGPMADDYKSGLHFMFDLGYQIKQNLGIMAMLGNNEFQAKDENVFVDTYWLNVSVNGKYTRPLPGPFDLQVHAGPGIYIPETGSNKFGGNLGVAVDFEVTPLLSLQVGTDYHRIADSGDFSFIQYRGGVLLKF